MRTRIVGSDAGSSDVAALLLAAAATGLRSPASPLRVSDGLSDRWLRALRRERLSGHAARALKAGEISASDDVVSAVSRLHMGVTLRVLQLEQTLLHVVDRLHDAGVELRVLKGPALSRTVYADPQLRSFVDVDVLVRGHDIERAVAALAADGYIRLLPELRPGFDRQFGKSVTLVDGHGCQADLHRTLVVGPFGLMIDADDLFAAQQPISVAGRTLPALGQEEQFVSVCYHAALGDVPPRLSVLRDVAEVLLHGRIDPSRVHALAQRWNGEIVVSRAIRLTWSVLGVRADAPLVAWAFNHQPSRHQRGLLACYVSAHRSNSWKYIASARVLPGMRAKFAYLRALLNPQRGFLRERRRGRRRWWLHGLQSLTRRSNDVSAELS